MTKNKALQTVTQEALSRELEFAILSVLAHYNGSYEEHLVEWYSALRLGLPQFTDTRQLLDVFKRLSDVEIIALDRHNPGANGGHGPDDDVGIRFAFNPGRHPRSSTGRKRALLT